MSPPLGDKPNYMLIEDTSPAGLAFLAQMRVDYRKQQESARNKAWNDMLDKCGELGIPNKDKP